MSRNLYLAPLEEVTGYVFRNALCEQFGGVDKYFAPFIVPTQKKILKTRERKDVNPENNRGLFLVPQILTASSGEFLDTVRILVDLGYTEINFNAGCPSGTVIRKGKGSGFLADLDKMDRFFYEVFDGIQNIKTETALNISVKTRTGIESLEEFPRIMEVYNRFPFEEIIVHGRLQKELYKGYVNLEAFEIAKNSSKNKLVFNGDICSTEDYVNLYESKAFIGDSPVMIGRGAVANPGLFREMKTGQKTTKEELKCFHDRIYQDYCEVLGEKDTLFKMKEVWYYMGRNFSEQEKVLKKIRKTDKPWEYKLAVEELFRG